MTSDRDVEARERARNVKRWMFRNPEPNPELGRDASKGGVELGLELSRFGYFETLHRVSSSLLGPVDPSFRALSGRLKFTVRRH